MRVLPTEFTHLADIVYDPSHEPAVHPSKLVLASYEVQPLFTAYTPDSVTRSEDMDSIFYRQIERQVSHSAETMLLWYVARLAGLEKDKLRGNPYPRTQSVLTYRGGRYVDPSITTDRYRMERIAGSSDHNAYILQLFEQDWRSYQDGTASKLAEALNAAVFLFNLEYADTPFKLLLFIDQASRCTYESPLEDELVTNFEVKIAHK